MATDWEDRGRHGRSDYENERGRGMRRGDGERDWADRAGDEVRSWFGDDDAERRRRMEDGRRHAMRDDERDHRGGYSGEYGSGGGYSDRGSNPRGSSRGHASPEYDSLRGYGGNVFYRGYSDRGPSGRDPFDGNSSGRSAQRYYQGGRGSGSRESGDRGFMERASDEVASWLGDEDAERRRDMDARHRGRGPKNYTRSDDRIREDVSDRLSDDAHIDASDVEVSVADGEVTLSGTVNERFAKRHAEDIAESVSGVKHVQNNLRVSTKQTSGTSGKTAEDMSSSAGSVAGTPSR